MPNVRLPFVALPLVGIVLAACTAAALPSSGPPSGSPGESGGPSPSAGPSESPTASPLAGQVEHPTGATDVVLRLEEGGGFMMPAFAVTQAPIFSLYGDGTVIFRALPPDVPPGGEGGVIKENPYLTTKLTPDQVDQLLTFALREGGLGLATKEQYTNDMVADASTSVFTIHADGIDRQVSVYALGFEPPDPSMPDGEERQAFGRLSERLRAFEQSAPAGSQPYEPTRYRGILLDATGQAVDDPLPWPWPNVDVSEFQTPPGDQGFFPVRTMSAEEIAATGVTDGQGGFQTLFLETPDGDIVGFAARPLLPDEAS
jgi:hypothetical protein